MSFLKKINLKEKIHILKDFFYELVFVKKTLYAAGISLIISFIVIQISTPHFYVSSTLREADAPKEGPAVSSGGSSVATLFGAAFNKAATATEEFGSNMNSYALAQRMWKKGWGSKIFGNGDMNDEYFNKIPKRHLISDRLGAFILGYDLFDYYSAYDLQGYIKSNISVVQQLGQTNITVSTLTRDKDFAIEFMKAVIIETDQYSKERLILKSKEIISATYSQLAVSKNSSIASALANTINSEYFMIANLENDMPHLVYVIDPPHSSEYPVAPKASAIFLSSAIVFIFGSILFSFIQKNKEELW